MKSNPTLADVRAAVEKAFEPDIRLLVVDGLIGSRQPITTAGWAWMKATRGIRDIDEAMRVAAEQGIEATLETH